MKYKKLFNSALSSNCMLSDEALQELENKQERVILYFARNLCGNNKDKSGAKRLFWESTKVIANKLGLTEDYASKTIRKLDYLFYKAHKENGKKVEGRECNGAGNHYYWVIAKEESVPLIKGNKTQSSETELLAEYGTFDESFDTTDEPSFEETKLVKAPKSWKENFYIETNSLTDKNEVFLYFEKIFIALEIEEPINDSSYDYSKVSGVSKGIRDYLGSSCNKRNLQSLCISYAESKIIGKVELHKNKYITEFRKFIEQ